MMSNMMTKYFAQSELDFFYGLTDVVQADVKEMLGIIERIERSGLSIKKAAQNEAARFAGKRGRSAERIQKQYRAFKKDGWQVLVNKAKLKGEGKTELPMEFVEYWRDLCLDHQRGKVMPCRNELLRRWQAGDVIPGYGTWRQFWAKKRPGVSFNCCPPDLPGPWSYKNLLRYAPKKEELELAQYGIFAGLKHQPHIIRTREGLRPLEWVAFDDWESDFMVTVPGVDRPVRLAGLIAKDVATDMWLRFVLRPAIPRADGSKDGLKKRDMKRLIAELVMNYGYPADYTMNLVFERGTATLPPDDVRALSENTGGMVIAHPTSMITGQVLLSGFADKATGSARSKGWVETGFNLLHNQMAFIKGQKGLSWEKAPAELETRTKHAAALLKAGQQLTADQRLQECIPFVDIYEAQETWNEVLVRMNNRHDHHCEGFQKEAIWRLADGDPWKPKHEALNFPPEVRAHFQWRSEMESPVQRFGRLLQGMTFERVPDAALPQILADHRTVKVVKHQIKIQVGGRTFVFFDRDCPFLVNDAEFLAYYVETEMDFIYLTDGDGAFKCRLPRVEKVRQGDIDGMKRQMADTKHQLKSVITRINSRDSRVNKTRKAIAGNEAAIAHFQELEAINIAPGTGPQVANATEVTRKLCGAQQEIYQQQQDAAAREKRDLETKLSSDELAAVTHFEDSGEREAFSDGEISDLLQGDDRPDEGQDYTDLF